MDYKEVKKGIKQAEFDKIKYESNIFFSVVAGIIVGVITKNVVIGIVVLFILGIISARKYFEMQK